MPDSDPSVILTGIRENFAARSKHAQGLGADPRDYRRLLAAVEAALKLADKWEAEARGIFLEAARTAEAGEVGVASALQSAAADLREAIRASLTGQEAGDER